MSLAEDIKRSSVQLKRFNESLTDPKCLLKVEMTSSCFDNNLSFSCNIIFSCMLLFYLRSTVYIFFKMIWNYKQHQVSQNTAIWLILQICHQVLLSLKLDNVARIFGLICLVFETWSSHHLLAKVLIKMGFFDSLVKFVSSWEHVYLKCKQNYFQRLLGFSNLNWSLSSCLKLWYINFFGSNFSNFVFRICIFGLFIYVMWWWSLKPVSREFVFINENFEFIISKFMYEPLSLLKHVFCFIIL